MAELPKTYDPKTVEPKWYQTWIDNRDFEADASSKKKPFSIVMPPPNITGVLTLGHVLNNAIQDILARRAQRFFVGTTPNSRARSNYANVSIAAGRERSAGTGLDHADHRHGKFFR